MRTTTVTSISDLIDRLEEFRRRYGGGAPVHQFYMSADEEEMYKLSTPITRVTEINADADPDWWPEVSGPTLILS
jgi:hypothetical protein